MINFLFIMCLISLASTLQSRSEGTYSKRTAKSHQLKELLHQENPLSFFLSLEMALHPEAGIHPLHSIVQSLADPELLNVLESNFKLVLRANSPALACSVRAIQVLLCRLHSHWKVQQHGRKRV